MKYFILLCLVFASTTSHTQNNVRLYNTEQFICESKHYPNEPFTIQVAFPSDYQAENNYPIVYLLDSDTSFGLTKGIVDLLLAGKEIRPIIIVGIAYNKDLRTWWVNRSRDFIPTLDTLSHFGKKWPKAGKADTFANFISNDLMPTIRNKYHVNEAETGIIGFSFGGLFASYVLFTNPDLFNNYVIISPLTQWDNRLISKLENSYKQNNNTLDKSIYIALSSLDSPALVNTPTLELIESINTKAYLNLKIEYKTNEGDTHYSGYPKGIIDGLKFVYPPKD